MKTFNTSELFVCGLINSGKDTVVRQLQGQGYHKLRLASTIKMFISDTLGVGHEQLETLKRENPEVRDMHHEISAMMDNFAHKTHGNLIEKGNIPVSTNRLEMILERTAMDFENHIEDYVISDIRAFHEIVTAFTESHTIKGIFLLRNNVDGEYVNGNHWTNKLDFNSDKLIELLNEFRERVIIIDNSGIDSDPVAFDKLIKEFQGDIHSIPLKAEDITGDVLCNFINFTSLKTENVTA